MIKKVFLDANILLDYANEDRKKCKESTACINYLLENSIKIYTSCDLITTIYYISSKRDKIKALKSIIEINRFCDVIDFSNNEIEQICQLMLKDSDYEDLEDTIQYILAKKVGCDLIISNDLGFVSKDVELISGKKFLLRF